MGEQIQTVNFDDAFAIHKHYIDVLNAVPDIVYWIDNECVLKGCNLNFVKLLGLQSPEDLNGDPYKQMLKCMPWKKQRVDASRLDDMKVIFSGVPQIDVMEAPVFDKDKQPTYFQSRRIPLFDQHQHIIGLVIVLTDVTDQMIKREADKNSAKQLKPSSKVIHHDEPNVLMVEDNVIAQKVEEELLHALHCHVDIAESGDKAIKLFDPGKYDMVFMDIGLEDTSGYMVAKKIRELEKKTKFHVPIIALTSYKTDNVKADCKDYLMDGVLTKPISQEQAKQLIKHYVHHEDIPVNGLESTSDD
jgi:CheY-like chemotaxis protein